MRFPMAQTPPVVKNLLIINVIFLLIQTMLPFGDEFTNMLALHFWRSDNFNVAQFFTYMFLHGDFNHLFFNMFALWMFGKQLEYEIGSKKFLIFYIITGVGSGLFHMGVQEIEFMFGMMRNGHSITVGASGAIFGILLAFGLMHPNERILLLIPPIPMKAKYFVMGYGAIELLLGFMNRQGDSVAHFAHLGGMFWGWLLLAYWKKKGYIRF